MRFKVNEGIQNILQVQKIDGRIFKTIRTHLGYILLHKMKTWDFPENETFHKITRSNKNTQRSYILLKEKQLQNMFEKSQILRATPHQHINLKQSLKIEIHKFWISNMHKICGSQKYIEIVINKNSGYYNMFS